MYIGFVFLVSLDGGEVLPRDAIGVSAVCDCGISCLYSLSIFFILKYSKIK